MEIASIFHSLDESYCKKEQRNRGVCGAKSGVKKKKIFFYSLKKTQICFLFLLISLSWHTGGREASGECPEVWLKDQSASPLSFSLCSICQNFCCFWLKKTQNPTSSSFCTLGKLYIKYKYKNIIIEICTSTPTSFMSKVAKYLPIP